MINTLPSPAVPIVTTPKKPLRPTISQPKPPRRSISGAVVVVDAGHGGRKPGTWPKAKSRLPEKTIVLDIANQVAGSLAGRGAKVIQTRTSDVDIDLDDRAQIAERSRCGLFVSIHANSSSRSSASGVDVFIYDKASTDSQRAAFRLVAAFRRAGIECRGVFRDNFHVLREHSRPAVLVECGFLSNSSDVQKLNTSSYRSKIADTIVDGIVDYFSR